MRRRPLVCFLVRSKRRSEGAECASLLASGGVDSPLHLVNQVLTRSDCSWCASASFPRVPRRGAISLWNTSCKSYNQRGNDPRLVFFLSVRFRPRPDYAFRLCALRSILKLSVYLCSDFVPTLKIWQLMSCLNRTILCPSLLKS